MKTPDGDRFLVGHDCGARIYGARFDVIKRDFDQARERASALRRVRKIRMALPGFLRWLRELERHRSLRAFHEAQVAFHQRMPRLWTELRMVASREGALVLQQEQRDFEAEERAKEQYERDRAEWNSGTVTERKRRRHYGQRPPTKPVLPMFKFVPVTIGTLGPRILFNDENPPAQAISSLVERLEGVLSQINRDDRPTDRILSSISKQASQQVAEVEAQIRRLEELVDFFQPRHLHTIVDWANRRGNLNGTYKQGVDKLTLTRFDGSVDTLQLPDGFAVPSLAPIEQFRSGLDGRGAI
jgi:hypothetical protein